MSDKDAVMWSTNETLLQSYRSIFISSQSFLLAVGAIVVEKSTCLLILIATISLFIIWYIWFPVVRARHRIVDYYKYSLKYYSQNGYMPDICTEEDYSQDEKKREAANKILNIKTHWRETRNKVDKLLPILFTIVWLSLVLYGLNQG